MNRRQFLERVIAGAAGTALAATLDVDRLLWEPGARTIVLPPTERLIGPWMLKGDIFAIEGVFATNPRTWLKPYAGPFLKHFLVTADCALTDRDVLEARPVVYPPVLLDRGDYTNCYRLGGTLKRDLAIRPLFVGPAPLPCKVDRR